MRRPELRSHLLRLAQWPGIETTDLITRNGLGVTKKGPICQGPPKGNRFCFQGLRLRPFHLSNHQGHQVPYWRNNGREFLAKLWRHGKRKEPITPESGWSLLPAENQKFNTVGNICLKLSPFPTTNPQFSSLSGKMPFTVKKTCETWYLLAFSISLGSHPGHLRSSFTICFREGTQTSAKSIIPTQLTFA